MHSDASIESAIYSAVLKLGYPALRLHQKNIIASFVKGRDVFVCLPTGSGKSLCFAILPEVFQQLTSVHAIVLVVSPLISLMQDQVRSAMERNITAVYAGEALQEGSPNYIMEGKLYRGEYQLVFVIPEMILCDERWDEILSSSEYQEHLVGLVVDEAHGVKTWTVSFN